MLSRNIQGSRGRQKWKFICWEEWCNQMRPLPLANPHCPSRRQKKALSQDSQCHTVPHSRSKCISQEVNSCYLPITWRHRTADGRAFYIRGASLSHQCLVTTNPAAPSDSFLSDLSLCIPGAAFVFERPSALNNVSQRSHMSLTIFAVCVSVMCRNKQLRVTLCMYRGKGKRFFFILCRVPEKNSWILVGQEPLHRKWRSSASLQFTPTIIQGSSEQEDNYTDSTHACTSRRLA